MSGSDFCKTVVGSTFDTAYPNALSERLIPIAVTTTSDKSDPVEVSVTLITLLAPTVISLVPNPTLEKTNTFPFAALIL